MRVLVLADSRHESALVTRAIRVEALDAQIMCVHDHDTFDATDLGGYDLVATDWRLLWAEGGEIVRTVKRFSPESTIVVITDEHPECCAEAHAAGADQCWDKSEASLGLLREAARRAATDHGAGARRRATA